MKEVIEQVLSNINQGSNNNYIIREEIDSGKDSRTIRVDNQLISNEGMLWKQNWIGKETDDENLVGKLVADIYMKMICEVYMGISKNCPWFR